MFCKKEAFDQFKSSLSQYSYAAFLEGTPYNEASMFCCSYKEFLQAICLIEEAARDKGLSEEVLSAYRGMYENIYFPNETMRRCDNEAIQRRIPKSMLNASPEAGISVYGGGKTSFHLRTGDYVIEDNMLFLRAPDKPKQMVCSHLILPVAIYIDESIGFEVMDIAFYRDDKWTHCQKKKSELYSANKLLKMVDNGIDVSDETAPLLAQYFREIERLNRGDLLPIIKMIPYIGWLDDTCKEFLPYTTRYQYSKADSYRREFDAIRSWNGSLPQWVQLMSSFRDSGHIPARIILAASFASVLVAPMNCLPFMLNIWGSFSGSGKTVALMTAASVWARPGTEDGFIKTMNSTDIACEQYAQFFRNFPLCLDELQTIQNKKNFDTLIYSLCEGIPRGRGAREGGVRAQNEWRNCIIVTGEQPIISANSRAGSINRVVELECSDVLFWNDASRMNQYCNELRACYGCAGPSFVSFLTEDDNMAHAQSVFTEHRDALNPLATGKQVNSAALILTADTLACEWIFNDEIKLTVDDILPYLKTDEDVDTGARAHQALLEWIVSNEEKFKKGSTNRYGRYIYRKEENRWACAFFRTKFTEVMDHLGFNDGSYLSWAKREGKIAVRSDGKHLTIQVPFHTEIGRKPFPCIAVFVDSAPTDESVMKS